MEYRARVMKEFTHLGQYVVWSYNLYMKRIILLCLISAAFIYNILPSPEAGPQIDEIRTRMAASRARVEEVKPAVTNLAPARLVSSTGPVVSTVSDSAVTEESESEAELAHNDDIPWEDIKNGWRTDLKDFLLEVDPDRGEEIFNAYMEEAESYEAEIEALNKEAEKAGKESRQDFETLIGQLEVRHEERLKEILGNYYSEVTDRHQQYNASLEHLAHSEEAVVGVSL